MTRETSSAAAATPTVVLDSLPYIEQTHNDYEEYALALIEEEMNQMKPPPSSTGVPPVKFRSPLMETEYKTLINDDETEVIPRGSSTTTAFIPPKIARPTNNVKEWTNHAIPTARQRLEAERIRSMVLEAQKEDAVPTWKLYNQTLDNVKTQLTTALQTTGESVEEINYQRQNIQTQSFQPQFDDLTTQYQQMVYRRNQLEYSIEGIKRASAAAAGVANAGATDASAADATT